MLCSCLFDSIRFKVQCSECLHEKVNIYSEVVSDKIDDFVVL